MWSLAALVIVSVDGPGIWICDVRVIGAMTVVLLELPVSIGNEVSEEGSQVVSVVDDETSTACMNGLIGGAVVDDETSTGYRKVLIVMAAVDETSAACRDGLIVKAADEES